MDCDALDHPALGTDGKVATAVISVYRVCLVFIWCFCEEWLCRVGEVKISLFCLCLAEKEGKPKLNQGTLTCRSRRRKSEVPGN